MTRRNRFQNERDTTAASRAVEAAALGTAAGSMILGAVLPHRSDAKPGSHEQTQPTHSAAAEHRSELPGVHDDAAAPVHTGAEMAGHSAATDAISPPEGFHGAAGAGSSASIPLPTGGESLSTGSGSLDVTEAASALSQAGDSTGHHDSGAAQSTVPAVPELAHSVDEQAWEMPAGTLAHMGGIIETALSSVSHALTETFSTLSATLSGVTGALSNPFGLGGDNPVEAILQGTALELEHNLAFIQLPDGQPDGGTLADGPIGLLASLPGNILGVPDGGMDQTFGAPETLADMHPSIASFGDLSNPIQVGFAGQALTHLADGHDLAAHGTGSLLHGFV